MKHCSAIQNEIVLFFDLRVSFPVAAAVSPIFLSHLTQGYVAWAVLRDYLYIPKGIHFLHGFLCL